MAIFRLAPILIAAFCFSKSFAGPAPETILFMGSSTIYNWQRTIRAHFPDYRTITEGKGGSDFPWLIAIARPAMLKHKPDRVVIYSGDNDLANQASPETVVRNFERTVEIIREVQSEVPIYVISVKPAPGRRGLLAQVKATNALLKNSAERLPKVIYVDVFNSMISKTGEIAEINFDPEDSSRIHLSPTGYALWTKILAERLKKP